MGEGERRTGPPEDRVRRLFDDVVPFYDALNDVLSAGFDRRWRRVTAGAVSVGPGGKVLDVGCGTGRLGERLVTSNRVVGVDTSGEMLRAARRRLGVRLPLVQGSAFRLPFVDGSFDAVVSGFVLRNLDDLAGAFGEIARVLVPDGRFAVVDITEPRGDVGRRLFDAYFRLAAPAVGALVGRRDEYRYLTESLSQLPPAADVADLIKAAGFARVSWRSLAPGMVTLWTGAGPVRPPARGVR